MHLSTIKNYTMTIHFCHHIFEDTCSESKIFSVTGELIFNAATLCFHCGAAAVSSLSARLPYARHAVAADRHVGCISIPNRSINQPVLPISHVKERRKKFEI